MTDRVARKERQHPDDIQTILEGGFLQDQIFFHIHTLSTGCVFCSVLLRLSFVRSFARPCWNLEQGCTTYLFTLPYLPYIIHTYLANSEVQLRT